MNITWFSIAAAVCANCDHYSQFYVVTICFWIWLDNVIIILALQKSVFALHKAAETSMDKYYDQYHWYN